MARQKGHIKYEGTIGDIRHFKIKGSKGHFAGLIGGPTAEQIKKDPKFARTRENMSEFSGSASIAKSVRVAFSELVKNIADPRLAGRLTGIMNKISKEDTSNKRGQRSFLLSQFSNSLQGLNFNKNVSFTGIFNAPYTITENVGRNSSDLVIPAFNPMININVPAGATHFRIINAIGVVSDFAYQSTSKAYEPIEKKLNETSKVAYSDYLDVTVPTTADTTVTAALNGSPVMTADVAVINAIGIEFYQKVGTEYYLFTAGNSARIEKIF